MNNDSDLKLFLSYGYSPVKRLKSGEIAGCMQMLFTVSLCVGLDEDGYRTRFCYPDQISAESALQKWDGIGDPSGPWIKEKGNGAERSNPSHKL